MFTFSPHHVNPVKVRFQLNKTVWKIKFIVNLTSHSGQRGHRGQKLWCVFPRASASCVGWLVKKQDMFITNHIYLQTRYKLHSFEKILFRNIIKGKKFCIQFIFKITKYTMFNFLVIIPQLFVCLRQDLEGFSKRPESSSSHVCYRDSRRIEASVLTDKHSERKRGFSLPWNIR